MHGQSLVCNVLSLGFICGHCHVFSLFLLISFCCDHIWYSADVCLALHSIRLSLFSEISYLYTPHHTHTHSSFTPAFFHLLFHTLSIWPAVGYLSLPKLTGQKSGGAGLLTWHIYIHTPFPLSSFSVPSNSSKLPSRLSPLSCCPLLLKSEHLRPAQFNVQGFIALSFCTHTPLRPESPSGHHPFFSSV